ncbi:MAG TPA: asparagine synthase-related protein [Terriglobia bacterium]|nr:asparagine synthase-related protein [Terriglobia bacterium]
MIELCAVSYSNVGAAIRHQRDAARRQTAIGKRPKYYKECGRGVSMGISMMVSGDEPLEPFVYESPEVSVICRADLLLRDSGETGDASTAPAQFLAQLYAREGDGFVKHLRGTFAVILYDHKCRLLKAWTDHFAAEKLVFTNASGFFAVATDLRLLLPLLSEKPEIDLVAVQRYLQYTCVPAPQTIFKGISRLQPGHQLTSRPAPAVRPYWDMSYSEVDHGRTESEWAAATENAIRSAVSLNLSGVDSSQLGCFLSGGTDSSSVAGLMSQSAKQPARTFSIGFDDPRYNEIEYARIAARHNKSRHSEYFVTPDDILALIERAVPAFDEPFGNSSIIPTYYCARLAAENGVTHLLAGDGGDELFGGNARYLDDRVFQHYSSIPGSLRGVIEPVVSAGSAWTNLSFFDRAARYIRRSNIRVPDRLFSYTLLSSVPGADLFTADFLAAVDEWHPLAPARDYYGAAPAKNDLNRWLYLDLKMTIADNDIRKVTVMSKLAGVTARYPLLDPTLAEFTGTIPAGLKVHGTQLRYLFKKAMAGILPTEIIAKRKHGFGLPYAVWLNEHARLRDFTLDVLGSTRFQQRGYFRKGVVEWLWSQYENVHQRFYGDVLWVFLMLELWLQKQYDTASETGIERVLVAHRAH